MKRIVALALAVIMTMTMFCALTVTSSADDVDLTLKVVCSEPDENGVYKLDWYARDTSAYGFVAMNVELKLNLDEVDIITYEMDAWDDDEGDYVTTEYDMDITSGICAYLGMTTSKKNGGLGLKVTNVVNMIKDEEDESDATKFGFRRSGTNPGLIVYYMQSTGKGFTWNGLEEFDGVVITEENGLLLGTLNFKLKDGVTSTTITTRQTDGSAGNVIYATDSTSKPGFEKATVEIINATVTAEEDEPPVVEDPVTLAVAPSTSIRFTNPEGLRFTSEIALADGKALDDREIQYVNATTGEVVTEVIGNCGTYITAEGSEKVLDIPCGVGVIDGKYTAVISGLKSYTRTFYAQAYAVIDGVEYKSELHSGATAKATAIAILADESADYGKYAEKALELLNEYAA